MFVMIRWFVILLADFYVAKITVCLIMPFLYFYAFLIF